jgi:hypothetical protein
MNALDRETSPRRPKLRLVHLDVGPEAEYGAADHLLVFALLAGAFAILVAFVARFM